VNKDYQYRNNVVSMSQFSLS